MILFFCRLRAANSARLFDTLRGSCREAGPFLRAAKSAFKDGKADCHTSDIGHWFAMTGLFARGRHRIGVRTGASGPTKGLARELRRSGGGKCGVDRGVDFGTMRSRTKRGTVYGRVLLQGTGAGGKDGL